jgi:hypothetical protein
MKHVLPAVLILALGCGGGGEGSGGAQAGGEAETRTQTAEGAVPSGGARVTGTVRFTGTANNPTIDMSEEAACRDKHQGVVRDPVTVVNNGMLATVLVYVKSGLASGQQFPAPRQTSELDQVGCLYQPGVVGFLLNQPIKINNSDPVLHNIKAVPKVNRGFNISQPTAGMETERTFPRAEMAIPVECNVHGWMHAKVFVMEHPFYAVTGEDGSFTIEGLPPGTYTLEAWHEAHGTQTGTATVAADGSQTVSFTFTG